MAEATPPTPRIDTAANWAEPANVVEHDGRLRESNPIRAASTPKEKAKAKAATAIGAIAQPHRGSCAGSRLRHPVAREDEPEGEARHTGRNGGKRRAMPSLGRRPLR